MLQKPCIFWIKNIYLLSKEMRALGNSEKQQSKRNLHLFTSITIFSNINIFPHFFNILVDIQV